MSRCATYISRKKTEAHRTLFTLMNHEQVNGMLHPAAPLRFFVATLLLEMARGSARAVPGRADREPDRHTPAATAAAAPTYIYIHIYFEVYKYPFLRMTRLLNIPTHRNCVNGRADQCSSPAAAAVAAAAAAPTYPILQMAYMH